MDDPTIARLLAHACAAFDLDPAQAVPLGGMTGQVFRVADVVVRLGWPGVLDLEEAASQAAAAAVPVPEVLERTDGPAGVGGAAVLLPLVPGVPAVALDGLDPQQARRRGAACGQAQVALGQVAAPDALPLVTPAGAPSDAPARLLHLDLHPLNVLVGPEDDVVAVLDWTNAAAGPAELDRARTATILTLDPVARSLHADPTFAAFVDGWTETARLDALPAWATAWACRYMLDDLDGRYPDAELAHVHAALAAAEREVVPLAP